MTRPTVILYATAAALAAAVALPGAWVLLTLIPAAMAAAAAWWPPRPRHAARPAPVHVSATVMQIWLYGPGPATGSMDLTAELEWRRKYEIPDGLSPHTAESGSGPPIGQLHPRPYLVPFEARPPGWPREQLERLASTGDHHGLAAQLERAADLEDQDQDTARYLAAFTARLDEIRQAALAGWQ